MAGLPGGVLPPGAYDNNSQELVRYVIPSLVLPTVAVALRFWARWVNVPSGNVLKFWWDDWLVLLSLPLAWAQGITTLYWTSIGLGRHVYMVSPSHLKTGLIILYANFFFWNIGLTLSKLSVLCLYARIFKVKTAFRRALWIVGALNVAWEIFAFFSALFQCTPIEKVWNPLMKGGVCINYYKWFLTMAISTFLLDIIILLLPMPILYQLSLSTNRKVLVAVLFLCGYANIAFSVGRTVAIIQEPDFAQDPTYSMIRIGRWLIMENPLCIFSICLPAMFSLVRRAIEYGPASLLVSKSYAFMSNSGSGYSKTSAVRPTKSMKNINNSGEQSFSNENNESHGDDYHFNAVFTTFITVRESSCIFSVFTEKVQIVRYLKFKPQQSVLNSVTIIHIQNFLSEDGEYFEYFDGSSPESGLRVVKQLEKHIAAEGPFDGVIAFSQGAAVAATLLARPLCQDASKSCLTPFKCAIFFSAVPAVDYDALSKGETRIIDNITDGELIQIPTAHIWGRKDSEWSDGSEKLSKICAADSRSVYIHDGGHEVPGLRLCDSLAETVKAIRRTVDRALFRQ
ncbi:hypothetical protein G7Y89_g8897 [Cudoniella acicularis]|uniref:Serine hydrolase FSH domain-containing protein n=1 Tax=Cudoniella acicularis TaxID=354080 RepID=A0A8H4RFQ2_9HELO|nr:hypothetical protein G7Y89_g8897 [Cudoniella acicularis]